MAEAKRIGVLTSGGDCAGLNAAIRAVAYRAIEGYGFRVFGIHHGTHGLMETPVAAEELTLDRFDGNILRMGGTILGSMNRFRAGLTLSVSQRPSTTTWTKPKTPSAT